MADFAQKRILKLCNGFWYLLILLGVGLIAAVFFRWKLYANNWVALVVYLSTPFFLIAMAVCIVKLVAPLHRVNITLLAFSVVFSAFLIEVYLDLYGHIDLRAKEASANGIHVDPRWQKTEVLEDLRKEGRQAYPTIHPSFLLRDLEANRRHSTLSVNGREFLPLGGISGVLTVYNRESGQWVIYKSDEYGFRNPPGVWKSEGVDLAIIGDSFGHGAGLMDGEDIASLLRANFPTTVNLANGGNGPLLELATLREYCRKLKSKFVVYLYYEGNDLIGLNFEKNSPLLMSYLEDDSWSQNLYEKQKEIDSTLIDFSKREFRNYRLARLGQIFRLSNFRARIGLDLAGRQKENKKNILTSDLALFESILKQMNGEVRGWGGTFVVAYLPAWERYKNPDAYHAYRKDVLEILKKNEIPTVDLNPIFKKQKDVFSLFHFGLDGHYNSTGAKFVAEEVKKKLKSLWPG